MGDRKTGPTGGCLCGAVRYAIGGAMRPVVACHCAQCRKTSGNFVAATAVHEDDLRIEGEDNLRWFRSSAWARRGFCGTCGSNLFWKRDGDAHVSIMAGTLDGATGLRTAAHIFVADKGDYYDIGGDAPRHRQSGHGIPSPTAGEKR